VMNRMEVMIQFLKNIISILSFCIIFLTSPSFAASPDLTLIFTQVMNLYSNELESIQIKPKVIFDDHNPGRQERILLHSPDYLIIVPHTAMTDGQEHPLVFLFFACHEMGHIFAQGESRRKMDLVAEEGAADYFAGADCLRKVFRTQLYLALSPAYSDEQLFLSAVAQELSDYYYIENEIQARKPDLNKVDKSIVTSEIYGYPSLQCELDSFISGTHCNQNVLNKDKTEITWSPCAPEGEDLISSYKHLSAKKIKANGYFPRCWYVP
jgi:hypothetical protein